MVARDYHIHLGVHRTATTHLQDTLELHQDALRSMGIEVPTRARLRERNLGGRALTRGLAKLLPDSLSEWRLSRILDTISGHGTRTVISEEKLLGFVRDLLTDTVYPELERRVSMLHGALGKRQATLYLSVRDPGTLLPSAYVQCLRMGNQGLPDFQSVQVRAIEQPLRWSQLARRIQAAAPGRPLRIWTFESYIKAPSRILNLLTCTNGVDWRHIEAPVSTRGISLETIARIRALPSNLNARAYREACLRIGREDKKGESFRPFSTEEKAHITRAYQEDLTELRHEQPDIFAIAPA